MRMLAQLLLVVAFSTSYIHEASAQSRPDFVQFKIQPVKASQDDAGETTWQASYGDDEKFLISLRLGNRSPEALFDLTKGSFRHVSGSNPRVLLKNLARALGAKRVPSPSKKVDSLVFDVDVSGTHETRIEGGGFSNRPPGNWIVTKIFLAKGEGEVYLNLDPISGIGEFALKDEEYGDTVLRELASVL